MISKEVLGILVSVVVAVVCFQNCSSYHAVGSGSLSLSSNLGSPQCTPILAEGFQNYHTVLKNKCASCHVPGGAGNGVFAASDVNVALPAFLSKGEAIVFSMAGNSAHKPPYTGDETAAELEAPRQEFQAAMTEFDACNSNEGTQPQPTPPPANVQAALYTNAKTLEGTTTTITFDLDTDIADASKKIAGATLTLKVLVTETIVSGVKYTGFAMSDPTLKTGAAPVHIKSVSFKVIEPTREFTLPGYTNIDRWVPANSTRVLQTGAVNFSVNAIPVQFAVGFDQLRSDSNLIFTPATYRQLTSASVVNGVANVFTTRCAGCHTGGNPPAGLSITASDYLNLKLQGQFKPFDLENSPIWKSVESGSMPPNRTLPAAEVEFIKGWILDGAREN